jgi:hypothetical protein
MPDISVARLSFNSAWLIFLMIGVFLFQNKLRFVLSVSIRILVHRHFDAFMVLKLIRLLVAAVCFSAYLNTSVPFIICPLWCYICFSFSMLSVPPSDWASIALGTNALFWFFLFHFLSDSSEPESESDFLQEMKLLLELEKYCFTSRDCVV